MRVYIRGALVGAMLLALEPVSAAATELAVQPFRDILIRPVPGYTAACTTTATHANRSRNIDHEIIVVVADGRGSRIRTLTNHADGTTLEFETRFDEAGLVVGGPQVKQAGVIRADEESRLAANMLKKGMENTVYIGRPVSSGDDVVSPATPEEIEAYVDTMILDRRGTIQNWRESGQIRGRLSHETFGEVVVLEWNIGAVMTTGNGVVRMTGQGIEYYSTQSGIVVSAYYSLRYANRVATWGSDIKYGCRYVVTPSVAAAATAIVTPAAAER